MNKKWRALCHVIIWYLILLFFLFFGSKGFNIRYDLVVIIVYFGLINIAVFYVNYLYLLPKFLSRKKYTPFALSVFLLLLISGIAKYGLALYFKEFTLMRNPHSGHALTFGQYYAGAVLVSAFFVFLSSAVRFASDWFMNEQLRKDLENEKLFAELAFLRSQINPHFLFNSLNNIYSLAYQKSAKAPVAILKLSEIMRYMLGESNESFVALAKEINYLENYIELQKLRFKNDAFIDLKVSGDEYKDQLIAPLILIAFVENAFKHGDATDPDHPIRIRFNISPGMLYFKVENKKANQNKDETSGVGLNNVKRRLDLLYPEKYKLQILDTRNGYTCELSLVL